MIREQPQSRSEHLSSIETERSELMTELRRLKTEFPVLEEVELDLVADPSLEGGSFYLPESDADKIGLGMASGGVRRYEQLKKSREAGVRAMAEAIGVPFNKIDGRAIRQFILFHEAGHAHDFLTNFADQMDMESAVKAWFAINDAQLKSLPFPGLSPAALRKSISNVGGFSAWQQSSENRVWCDAHGIEDETQLFGLQEAAYRQLDKERYADSFASKAIRRLNLASKRKAA